MNSDYRNKAAFTGDAEYNSKEQKFIYNLQKNCLFYIECILLRKKTIHRRMMQNYPFKCKQWQHNFSCANLCLLKPNQNKINAYILQKDENDLLSFFLIIFFQLNVLIFLQLISDEHRAHRYLMFLRIIKHQM